MTTTVAGTNVSHTSFRHRVAEGVRTVGYAALVVGMLIPAACWFIARLIDDR